MQLKSKNIAENTPRKRKEKLHSNTVNKIVLLTMCRVTSTIAVAEAYHEQNG